MKATILRLTLATALALGSLTACTKNPDDSGTAPGVKELKDGKKKKLKKDGTKKEKKKDKKAKDDTAPATPDAPAKTNPAP